MEFLKKDDNPVEKGFVEMSCPTCKRKFAVPIYATLLLIKNCEECQAVINSVKKDKPEELKKALGEK